MARLIVIAISDGIKFVTSHERDVEVAARENRPMFVGGCLHSGAAQRPNCIFEKFVNIPSRQATVWRWHERAVLDATGTKVPALSDDARQEIQRCNQ